MVKVRGQNYPAVSLAEAILQTKLIYQQERSRALDQAIIAKALGSCGTHTAFASTIPALLKYGLLESVESLFKVSEDAENIILLSRGRPDRVKALRNAVSMVKQKKIEPRNETGPRDDSIQVSICFSRKQTCETATSWVYTCS